MTLVMLRWLQRYIVNQAYDGRGRKRRDWESDKEQRIQQNMEKLRTMLMYMNFYLTIILEIKSGSYGTCTVETG